MTTRRQLAILAILLCWAALFTAGLVLLRLAL